MTVAGNARRGPLAGEVAALGALVVLDTVFGVRVGLPDAPLAQLVASITPGVGPVLAVLAVLRRRFADRVGVVAAACIGLSLLCTGLTASATALGQLSRPQPSATETLALALLVGACAHRLALREAGLVAAGAGLAMVGAPIARYGPHSPEALFAVAAALVWGGGLAVGLILRDADARRVDELARVRGAERLALARELHDLVAHHITGVVVSAQAATVIAGNGSGSALFAEIERAGTDALAAMRRLVGMLRTDQEELFSAPADLADAVSRAVGDDERVDLAVPEDLAALPVHPETASTVHRVLLEALTNARRHAPSATRIEVGVRIEADALVVEVVNDGARPPARESGGYGLIGMTERVTALNGSLQAGVEPGQRWRVTARLPLAPTEQVEESR